MNLLRDLPLRDDDGNVRVVVETPGGSRVKYKYDERLGVFSWSRLLPVGERYPFDYGFLPRTLAEDGGPVKRNDRVVAVPVLDPTAPGARDIADLPTHVRAQLEHFFTASLAFTGKRIRLCGWADAAEAAALVAAAHQRF